MILLNKMMIEDPAMRDFVRLRRPRNDKKEKKGVRIFS